MILGAMLVGDTCEQAKIEENLKILNDFLDPVLLVIEEHSSIQHPYTFNRYPDLAIKGSLLSALFWANNFPLVTATSLSEINEFTIRETTSRLSDINYKYNQQDIEQLAVWPANYFKLLRASNHS